MGLVAAVATSDTEMRERVRGSMGEDERRVLEDCEQCVAFMREVGVDVPDELKAHPQINMCNKIAMLPAEKLEAILRKFLKSDKIRRAKLAELAKSCRGEACAKIRDISNKVRQEEISSEKSSESSETGDDVASSVEEKASSPSPKEEASSLASPEEASPSLTPAEEEIFRMADRNELESWKSVDHHWDSSSDVESQISGYSM